MYSWSWVSVCVQYVRVSKVVLGRSPLFLVDGKRRDDDDDDGGGDEG